MPPTATAHARLHSTTGRVRCTPDPCAESSTNSQGHRMRATGRTLSVSCSPDSCAKRVSKPTAHRTLSTGHTPVRPVHSAHLRHRLTPHRTLWTNVWCCQHQRSVSVSQRETLSQLLQISHRRNRKYTLNFLKSAKSRRAPPPLERCQDHQVYTTMCKCVSIFTSIFPKDLASQLATPLDPNTYAKLDRSSGSR